MLGPEDFLRKEITKGLESYRIEQMHSAIRSDQPTAGLFFRDPSEGWVSTSGACVKRDSVSASQTRKDQKRELSFSSRSTARRIEKKQEDDETCHRRQRVFYAEKRTSRRAYQLSIN